MATTTRVIPNAGNNSFLERLLIHHAIPSLDYSRFGMNKKVHPLNNGGDKINQRVYYNFQEDIGTGKTYVTDPTEYILNETEEAGGKENSLRYDDYTATLINLGGHFDYFKKAMKFNYENVRKEGIRFLGEQAGLVYDAFIRNQLMINTAITGTSGEDTYTLTGTVGTDGPILRKMFLLAYAELIDRSIKPVSKIVKATERVATEPVRPGFFAIVNPFLVYALDLMVDTANKNIAGFKSWDKYSNSGAAIAGEEGMIGRIRLIQSAHAFRSASATGNVFSREGDFHHIIILGKDAFSTVGLQGEGRVNMVSKGFGEVAAFDRHNHRASEAWDTWVAFLEQNPFARKRLSFGLENVV